MPTKVKVYDRGRTPDPKKEGDKGEPAVVVEHYQVNALEMVKNDPARYALHPWRDEVRPRETDSQPRPTEPVVKEAVRRQELDDAARAAENAGPAAQPDRSPPLPAEPDDLTRINGIGPKLAEMLNAEGITTYAGLAALDPEREAELDGELKLAGRIKRQDWIGQAKALAKPA